MMGKKKHNWSLADVSYSRCGTMVCNVCNKPITEGQYRYYMAYDRWFNDTGFVTQHRACSENDPRWKKHDEEAKQHELNNALFLQDCLAFKAKWGIEELDEIISYLKGE